jgi:hypothetical protein
MLNTMTSALSNRLSIRVPQTPYLRVGVLTFLFRTCVVAILFFAAMPLRAQSTKPPFTDYPGFVAWMEKTHKAPFKSASTARPATNALLSAQTRTLSFDKANEAGAAKFFQDVKVNQDRNPWPKAGIASAVDPSDPKTWVVVSNDFRGNATHLFYHVSTDRGKTWTDDSLAFGADPNIGGVPLTFQVNPAISFDAAGNSHFSALSGNQILDFNNNYLNLDSEVDEFDGFGHGTYSNSLPTLIDAQSCSGTFDAAFVCNGTVSQPLNATDANNASPNAGTNYVFYTYFCNLSSGSCTDGSATIPSFASVILESHSPAAGQPYTAPALVSGSLAAAQYSEMVIDASGTPHIFFDDFSSAPTIHMWESTLTGGVWSVSKNPVATFVYNGLTNPNWSFTDSGAAAPRCAIRNSTAYCAFSANQVGTGTLATTPSVYLATVNINTAASRIARVNNDPINGKHHFFAAPAATPSAVYVGWYDDRKDSTNTNVEYFVGESFDDGRTFPIQHAVSDVPFNPCNGFSGCGYFGDYTQLAAGPDGQVHAAWNDTRDGASMQIWSQSVRF